MPKIKEEKESVVITDVLETYFTDEAGVEKVKRVSMNGEEIVKEEITNA
jgi:hypothetical protein